MRVLFCTGFCFLALLLKVECRRKESCLDNNRSCRRWRLRGYCRPYQRYYNYMRRSCKKSCGFCRKTETTTMKPVTLRPSRIVIVKVLCVDRSRNCGGWKKRGHCRRTSRYFRIVSNLCPKTCQVAFCRIKTTVKPKTTPPRKTVSLTCGRNEKKRQLIGGIIDGNNAPKDTWIWQAALEYYDVFECGGTLITPSHVLTAAHCLEYRDKEGHSVILGDHKRTTKDGKEQIRKVDKVWVHKKYNGETLDNDIGILRLSTPVKLNRWVGVACLPNAGEKIQKNKCYATGWGKVDQDGESVDVLQEGNLPLVAEDECKSRNADEDGNTLITKNMICAGRKTGTTSGCQGDSGGPFTCLSQQNKWVLQGVVSWGSRECKNQDKYTVFTKVINYIDWIKEVINEK